MFQDKQIIKDGNYAPPANGILGSTGSKLSLKEGTVSTTSFFFRCRY
jgi:hypothetical protein